jgi:predicted nucleotidyltransferase
MARFEMTEGQMTALRRLCQKYNITSLAMFGSALTQDFDFANSDLDFVAVFGPPPEGLDLGSQFFDCLVEFEELFNRRVDLLERRAIKNPYILKAVLATERLLYAA